MDKKVKIITKVGNSGVVILNKELLYKAELEIGDKVEVACTKNKITLKKVKNEE